MFVPSWAVSPAVRPRNWTQYQRQDRFGGGSGMARTQSAWPASSGARTRTPAGPVANIAGTRPTFAAAATASSGSGSPLESRSSISRSRNSRPPGASMLSSSTTQLRSRWRRAYSPRRSARNASHSRRSTAARSAGSSLLLSWLSSTRASRAASGPAYQANPVCRVTRSGMLGGCRMRLASRLTPGIRTRFRSCNSPATAATRSPAALGSWGPRSAWRNCFLARSGSVASKDSSGATTNRPSVSRGKTSGVCRGKRCDSPYARRPATSWGLRGVADPKSKYAWGRRDPR